MNTTLNTASVLLLVNNSGSKVLQGTVVINDATSVGKFTTTTTANFSSGPVGIVLDSGGIEAGSQGAIGFLGYAPKILLTGSAVAGDFVYTASSAGQATPSSTLTAGAFGQVLSTGTTPAIQLLGPLPLQTIPSAGASTGIADGRLTLTTNTPVTSSDVTGASAVTLYYTPYKGDQIGLYTGSTWTVRSFSEINVSLSGVVSGKNYDVWAYWTGSAVALELSSAWTNDTTRATAVARQNGVVIKNGDATRRYLGTIRAAASNQSEDSVSKRFVWNAYNRISRPLYRQDSTLSWTHSGTTWRSANNSTSNRVEVVVGAKESQVEVTIGVLPSGNVAHGVGIAVGEDSTTTPTQLYQIGSYMLYSNGNGQFATTTMKKMPEVGYHYYQWLELGNGETFYSYRTGLSPEPDIWSGIVGTIDG